MQELKTHREVTSTKLPVSVKILDFCNIPIFVWCGNFKLMRLPYFILTAIAALFL